MKAHLVMESPQGVEACPVVEEVAALGVGALLMALGDMQAYPTSRGSATSGHIGMPHGPDVCQSP